MKILILFVLSFTTLALWASDFDEIKVYKSKHRMDMLFQGEVVKSFRVMLSRGGKAAKRKAGDNLVPEGQYTLDYKNPESLFFKSLHISYPNDEDTQRAHEEGVEPGGDIMIHGYPNHPSSIFKLLKKLGLIKLVDWTAGCISVDDHEMNEIFNSIDVPMPITIYH